MSEQGDDNPQHVVADLTGKPVDTALALLQNEMKHMNLGLRSFKEEMREAIKIANEARDKAHDNAKDIKVIKEWRISIDGWKTWVSRTFWGAVIGAFVLIVVGMITSQPK